MTPASQPQKPSHMRFLLLWFAANGLGCVPRAPSPPDAPPGAAPVAGAEAATPAEPAATELSDNVTPAARAAWEACEQRSGSGCLAVGVSYANGSHGLPQDPVRAADLYERACDLGELRGCNNLAVVLEKGEGRPVDAARALELYRRNCDAKHALACRNLGRGHRDGVGTSPDRAAAAKAFRAAAALSERDCEAGVAEGCSNLGFMYRSGSEGLPKDATRAAKYLQRACDMGYKAVCSRVHATE
ncbi:MAG: sel1 repeat family protein [Polyangiaceae bacterium]|nr:sel1 repeat family protein [Polyangiaceae bacterium]